MKNITVVTVFSLLFFIGCSEENDRKNVNTFYVEFVNITNDSFRTKIENGIFGKVSFYKENKLNILSENYITDTFPEMRYFYNAEGLKNDIKEGTKKIKVEFLRGFSYDTVAYSLEKYRFTNKQWVKTSDMGVLTNFTKMIDPEYQIKDLGKKVITNIVEYTYN